MNAKRPKKNAFDAQMFLSTEGAARKLRQFRRGERIFSQGDAAESVMYIQKGGVKLSVENGARKEAVVAMYGPGDFVGVGCIAGQLLRMGTATTMTPATVLAISKKEMSAHASPMSHVYPITSSNIRSGATFEWKRT